MQLPDLLGNLAFQRLALAVLDGRRFFKVLTLLPLSDDAFFLYNALKALQSFFEVFTVVNSYIGDVYHPLLFSFALNDTEKSISVKQRFGQKPLRLHRHPGNTDLPVQMGAGNQAGSPNRSYRIATAYHIFGRNG